MKNFPAAATFLFLLIFFFSFGCLQQQQSLGQENQAQFSQQSPQQTPAPSFGSELAIVASADFGNGTVLSREVRVANGSPALYAFSRAFNLSTKRFGDLGEYVYAVENVSENENKGGKYWQYYVDGKLAAVGAGSFVLEKDSQVGFRLERPKFG